MVRKEQKRREEERREESTLGVLCALLGAVYVYVCVCVCVCVVCTCVCNLIIHACSAVLEIIAPAYPIQF